MAKGGHVDGVAGGAGTLHVEEAPLPLLDGVLERQLREAALHPVMHQSRAARGHRRRAIELLHLGLVHLLGLMLDKEQALPEVEAGLDTQKPLAQDNERGELKDGVRR